MQSFGRQLVPDDTLIAGHRIAYGIHQPTDSEHQTPLVLIHGTPSSSVIWRYIAPKLLEAGYAVFTYDKLGYGMSERPWDTAVDTSVSAQVPILLQLMDSWGLKDAHVIAHDIGGAVAQTLGVMFADRVRSLILIDTCSFDSWPSERTRSQMAEGLGDLICARPARHRRHFKEWLMSTVEDKQAMVDGPLDFYLDIISGPVGQASLFQHQVRHYDPRHTDELTDRLHTLGEKPVGLIWGEHDGWQRLSWAQKLVETIPSAELQVVRGAGHFAMEDAPTQVAELILAFLSKHRRHTIRQT